MADLGVLKGIFEPYESTLQDTSYDTTNQKHLCQSQEKVINFDKYTQTKAQKSKCKANKSFDALYFHHETSSVYCVEFKNQKYSEIDSDDIRGKFIHGIAQLREIFISQNINTDNFTFNLFVVFKNPRETRAFHTRFAETETFFGLDTKKFKESLAKIKSLKIKTGYGAQFGKIYKKLFHDESNC